MDVLRVLTWNIRDMLGDPLAVHRVLRDAEADVVCLQEAPRLLMSRNRLAELARRSGMLYVCGGRASAGTALMARLRVEVHHPHAARLPVQGWRTRPRGYVSAQVGLPGTERVRVAGIHLGLSEQERSTHLTRMISLLEHQRGPVVVAGDLNEPVEGPSATALAPWVRDPAPGAEATFPARRPRQRIDAVLVAPDLEVVGYGWPGDVREQDVLAASDHRPVLAEIRLPARAAASGGR